MPYSRRSGRRYAAGSHTTLGAYPNRCGAGEGCRHGGKVTVSGPHALWFECDREGMRSWHVDCYPTTKGK